VFKALATIVVPFTPGVPADSDLEAAAEEILISKLTVYLDLM
jgi:hypothetical protein